MQSFVFPPEKYQQFDKVISDTYLLTGNKIKCFRPGEDNHNISVNGSSSVKASFINFR